MSTTALPVFQANRLLVLLLPFYIIRDNLDRVTILACSDRLTDLEGVIPPPSGAQPGCFNLHFQRHQHSVQVLDMENTD